MLVSELISILKGLNRPNSLVSIDSRACGYEFDEVTSVKSLDVVTIHVEKEN